MIGIFSSVNAAQDTLGRLPTSLSSDTPGLRPLF